MAQSHIIADGPTRRVLTDQETLSKAFLKAPQVTRVAQRLNGRFGFPRDVLTVKEFQAALKERLGARQEG